MISRSGAENLASIASFLTGKYLPRTAAGWLILFILIFATPGCATLSSLPDSRQHSAIPPMGTPRSVESQKGAIIKSASDRSAPQNLRVAPAAAAGRAHIGEASWYGPGFNGKKTASGDIFDDAKFTAAHKSLPLGSKARVTNIGSGDSVEVEINDRGPYVAGRIIDLSHAAAKALGIIDSGVTLVRIELISEPSRSVDASDRIRNVGSRQ
jgi:rare lipoprotein A